MVKKQIFTFTLFLVYCTRWEIQDSLEQTIMLSKGEKGFHGLLIHNGFLYGTTRTSPARVMRFKADDISIYEERVFPTGFYGAEQIVYASLTDKLYTIFNHTDKTVIAEIDPVSLNFITEKIVDTLQGTAKGAGQSMATDGKYLYAITFWDYGLSRIVKYSLSNFGRVGHIDLDSRYNLAHAIRYHNGMLYLTGNTTPSWVAKIDPSSLALVDSAEIPSGKSPTDDFGISGRYLFLGTETMNGLAGNGVIYRYELNNLSNAPTAAFTGEKKSQGGYYSGQCFAVQEGDKYIWALFATYPKGVLTRINPENPTDFQNYQLDYQYPNEIAFDGKVFL